MIEVRRHLKRPSKRTYLVLAILIGTIASAFSVGQSFKGDDDGSQLSVIGETASAPDNREIIDDVSYASAAATASDSAKAAASGSPLLWIVSSMGGTDGKGAEEQASSAEAFAERMVVFTAKINLEVGDVDSTLDDIRALTEDYGGFIASVNTRSGTGAITIRVPQASFYDAVSEMRGSENSRPGT